jgi:hypothetical protein
MRVDESRWSKDAAALSRGVFSSYIAERPSNSGLTYSSQVERPDSDVFAAMLTCTLTRAETVNLANSFRRILDKRTWTWREDGEGMYVLFVQSYTIVTTLVDQVVIRR